VLGNLLMSVLSPCLAACGSALRRAPSAVRSARGAAIVTLALLLGLPSSPSPAAAFVRQPLAQARAVQPSQVNQANETASNNVAGLRVDAALAHWWQAVWVRYASGAILLVAIVAATWLVRRRAVRERRLNDALKQREERLRMALWGAGEEFWDWNVPTGVLSRFGANRLLGFADEQELSSEEWRHHSVHPDDLSRVEDLLDAHLEGRSDYYESEHRIRTAAGRYVWVRARGKVAERDSNGEVLRVAGTARDVTAERAAARDRLIFESVINNMSEAVAVTDAEFNFVYVNPAFNKVTGYDNSEVIGRNADLLDCEQRAASLKTLIRSELNELGSWRGELWQRRRNDAEFLCLLELQSISGIAADERLCVAVFTDITQRKRIEQELRYLANYDQLTALPNRALFIERTGDALAQARQNASMVGVLFIDLDRFKHVNDSLGHAAGDRLLKAAAQRIHLALPRGATLARLGGDEFTVLLPDLTSEGDAEAVALTLLAAFSNAIGTIDNSETMITPSIGISVHPAHGDTTDALLQRADAAMYAAKASGRNTWVLYTHALEEAAQDRARMARRMQRALGRDEFSLVFQPQIRLKDRAIIGVEALLRWSDGSFLQRTPDSFIELAEDTGQIVPLGRWVLGEAIRQLAAWRLLGLGRLCVAVNVSMLQLLRGDLPGAMADLFREFDVEPEQLSIELTETMLMADAAQSLQTLRQIRELGVLIAIDDFGTGYSSLAQLTRLPVDTLKIDRSFISEIPMNPASTAVTATVIAMARNLGLSVVAEGVETTEQLAFLAERGCDAVQGFLFSKPLAADALAEYVRNYPPRAAISSPDA